MKKINILRILCVITAIVCIGVNEAFLVDGDDMEKLVLFFAMVASLSNLQLTFTVKEHYEK